MSHFNTPSKHTIVLDPTGDTVVDSVSNAVRTLDTSHAHIHVGEGYTLAERVSIANVGGTFEYLLVNPTSNFPHFRSITVASDGGPFDIDFYEDTTVSANGTLITNYNNKRSSSNTSNLLTYYTPTITADGTLLEPVLVPGTKQTGSFGSEASEEWNLKDNTNYMIRITNNTVGAGTSRFTLNMFWYEAA